MFFKKAKINRQKSIERAFNNFFKKINESKAYSHFLDSNNSRERSYNNLNKLDQNLLDNFFAKKHDHLIELGCGLNPVLSKYSESIKTYFGYDISTYAIASLKSCYPKQNFNYINEIEYEVIFNHPGSFISIDSLYGQFQTKDFLKAISKAFNGHEFFIVTNVINKKDLFKKINFNEIEIFNHTETHKIWLEQRIRKLNRLENEFINEDFHSLFQIIKDDLLKQERLIFKKKLLRMAITGRF